MAYKRFASMDIAIIGSGRVGCALAEGLAEAGHRVFMGVKNTARYTGKYALEGLANVFVLSIEEAAVLADVIIIATPASAVPEVAYFIGDVDKKVILDCTFGTFNGPVSYTNGVEAIIRISRCKQVAKCFNTTSYHTLVKPHLQEAEIEMYVAGDCRKAKQMAMALSKDLGFAQCYDLGGNANIALLEEMASSWIKLTVPVPAAPAEAVRVAR